MYTALFLTIDMQDTTIIITIMKLFNRDNQLVAIITQP